ncbi:MAG: hypothetical protein ACM37W_16345 [Actinomycetota bacterium]
MNQPPNPFEGNSSSPHPLAGLNLPAPTTEDDNLNSPIERPKVHDPRTLELLKRFYITLIVIGIAIGGVVSIGVIALMKQLGLTAVPAKVENSSK